MANLTKDLGVRSRHSTILDGVEKIMRFIHKRPEVCNLRMGRITPGAKGNRKEVDFTPSENKFIIFGPGGFQDFYYDLTDNADVNSLISALKYRFPEFKIESKITDNFENTKNLKEESEMSNWSKINPESVKTLKKLVNDIPSYDQQLFIKDLLSLLFRSGSSDEIKNLMKRDIDGLAGSTQTHPEKICHFRNISDWLKMLSIKSMAQESARQIITKMLVLMEKDNISALQSVLLEALDDISNPRIVLCTTLNEEISKMTDSISIYSELKTETKKDIDLLDKEIKDAEKSIEVEKNEINSLKTILIEGNKQIIENLENNPSDPQFETLAKQHLDQVSVLDVLELELSHANEILSKNKAKLVELNITKDECDNQIKENSSNLEHFKHVFEYFTKEEVADISTEIEKTEIVEPEQPVIFKTIQDVPEQIPEIPEEMGRKLLEIGEIIAKFDSIKKYSLFQGISSPEIERIYKKTTNSEILFSAIHGPDNVQKLMDKVGLGKIGKRLYSFLQKHGIFDAEGIFDTSNAEHFLKKKLKY